jgi:hypothetical protein
LALLATVWLLALERRQPRRDGAPLARGSQVIRLNAPDFVPPTGLRRLRTVVGWGGFTVLLGVLSAIAVTAVAIVAVLVVQQLLG